MLHLRWALAVTVILVAGCGGAPGLFDGFGETDHPHFDFDGSGVRFTIEPRENENGSNKQTPPA